MYTRQVIIFVPFSVRTFVSVKIFLVEYVLVLMRDGKKVEPVSRDQILRREQEELMKGIFFSPNVQLTTTSMTAGISD